MDWPVSSVVNPNNQSDDRVSSLDAQHNALRDSAPAVTVASKRPFTAEDEWPWLKDYIFPDPEPWDDLAYFRSRAIYDTKIV